MSHFLSSLQFSPPASSCTCSNKIFLLWNKTPQEIVPREQSDYIKWSFACVIKLTPFKYMLSIYDMSVVWSGCWIMKRQ